MKKFKFTEHYVRLATLCDYNKEILRYAEEPLADLEVYHSLNSKFTEHMLFSKITSLEFKFE